jgi:hypothetical protein
MIAKQCGENYNNGRSDARSIHPEQSVSEKVISREEKKK